jgi:hypothetical protein
MRNCVINEFLRFRAKVRTALATICPWNLPCQGYCEYRTTNFPSSGDPSSNRYVSLAAFYASTSAEWHSSQAKEKIASLTRRGEFMR